MSLMMAATATGQFQRISGTAQSNMVPCAGPGHLCYPQSIAVGPNANGSTNGTAWVLGTAKTSAGDYYVYRRQGSTWVPASIGAGTQIAVGIAVGNHPYRCDLLLEWDHFLAGPRQWVRDSYWRGPEPVRVNVRRPLDHRMQRFQHYGWQHLPIGVWELGAAAGRRESDRGPGLRRPLGSHS
jgi:hypothetical protein